MYSISLALESLLCWDPCPSPFHPWVHKAVPTANPNILPLIHPTKDAAPALLGTSHCMLCRSEASALPDFYGWDVLPLVRLHLLHFFHDIKWPGLPLAESIHCLQMSEMIFRSWEIKEKQRCSLLLRVSLIYIYICFYS